MDKKKLATILEIVPIVSAIVALSLVFLPIDTPVVRTAISCLMPVAFLGFAFFLVGRKLDREDKTVRVLGLLDLAATAGVILLYAAAIFAIAQ